MAVPSSDRVPALLPEPAQCTRLFQHCRAVLFPIYQGMYERRLAGLPGPSGERDVIIQQHKDLQRAMEYLETRQDIALDRIGYFGVSGGLHLILVALDRHIRAAVVAEAGLSLQSKPPEID